MRTLIFQSHAPKPPYWIERCTATVREWTDAKGYDYRLIGDELFEGTPPAIARKAPSVLPLTDLGRLLWTQRYLKEGYERVAWIDSDVVIFDPENFSIDSDSKHLVCREVMAKLDGGKLITTSAVNPTITVFQAGSPLLDKWIDKALKIGERAKTLAPTAFGRDLLDSFTGREFPAIKNVGHFSITILYEIAGEPLPIGLPGERVAPMMRAAGIPFAAANLCGHHKTSPALYLKVVERLMETRGGVVNDKLPQGEQAQSRSN
jgi:hypothetical protein